MFTNKNYKQQHEQQHELQHEFENELSVIGTKLELSRHQVGTKLSSGNLILEFFCNPRPIQSIMEIAQWKDNTKFINKFINLFLELGLIQMTIPHKPNSSRQKYLITKKGNLFLKMINGEK